MSQPAPAPRFSRTPGEIQGPAAVAGEHTDATLADWGFSNEEIAALRESGAIAAGRDAAGCHAKVASTACDSSRSSSSGSSRDDGDVAELASGRGALP